jgi:hypothetical protein
MTDTIRTQPYTTPCTCHLRSGSLERCKRCMGRASHDYLHIVEFAP